MPTLTINHQSVTVPEGTTIIQAAERLGIEIPRYCYHPGLSIAGSCRMCLVEIEKMPKLQPACNTRVAEGMVVFTNTERVRKTVQAVLEFLLLNHPLDCPVCDQAGECFLQDYYMKFGLYDSRFNEDKVKRHKAQPIGPHVMLDNERCILCSRCVRFVREVTGTGELAIFNRGAASEIGLLPGQQLDNNYSGNVVDICPVGALTDRDFRFQCRVWYLKPTPSICPGCSRGCNIEIHSNTQRPHHAEGRRIMRLKPRFNPAVNQWWMCDEGRYGYDFIDAPSRMATCQLKQDGIFKSLDWDSAIQLAAQRLREAMEKHGPSSVVVLPSAQLTNEDLILLRTLFCDDLGISQIDFRISSPSDGSEDNLLLRRDRHPNTLGASLIFREGQYDFHQALSSKPPGTLKVLYLLDQDLVKRIGGEAVETWLRRFDFVIYQGSNHNKTSERADLLLPAATYAEAEGTFTNFAGRVQRIQAAVTPLGESRPHWEILMKLAQALGRDFGYSSAAALFEHLASSVKEFQEMRYDLIGSQGIEISQRKADTK
jgi:NADH-quinone oxidoreductase subunit G